MVDKIKLTEEGYDKLNSELRNLIDVERVQVKKELEEARAQGDLSENADYDAARARQAEVEARIKLIEDTISNSEIIKKSTEAPKRVSLGTTITIKNLSNQKVFTYQIVSAIEANPFKNQISSACPLGEAVLGKGVGDIVDVKSKNAYKVLIANIEII